MSTIRGLCAKVNVNDHVRIKLTEEGIEKWRMAYTDAGIHTYKGPEIDAEGWTRALLWHVMSILGPHITMGGKLLFQTEIILEDVYVERATV